MANKLGITEGNWWLRVSVAGNSKGYEVCWSEDTECVTDFVYEFNDGVLICDAGNTAQKCGLLPSELLKQRNALIEIVDTMLNPTLNTFLSSSDIKKIVREIKETM